MDYARIEKLHSKVFSTPRNSLEREQAYSALSEAEIGQQQKGSNAGIIAIFYGIPGVMQAVPGEIPPGAGRAAKAIQ